MVVATDLLVDSENDLVIREELEATRHGAWLRFTAAAGFTLFGPVQFLWESLFFWPDGWPVAGPFVFLVMTAVSGGFWWWWARLLRHRHQLRLELEQNEESVVPS